jgi:hypothetical protein
MMRPDAKVEKFYLYAKPATSENPLMAWLAWLALLSGTSGCRVRSGNFLLPQQTAQ